VQQGLVDRQHRQPHILLWCLRLQSH
jgi:hypothetical protein